MAIDNTSITVKGHVRIEDEHGNVLLDKENAIHPQNMAQIIARALSNEPNSSVYRIALGNGGTVTSTSGLTFRTPNDGQSPDTNTWQSRLYNETYSEIIDESVATTLLGTDPGSAGPNTGVRSGGGARPDDDPSGVTGVRSTELGLTSEVQIKVVLNPSEPSSQLDPGNTSVNIFKFDELGLYTKGAPAIPTSGYYNIFVGQNKNSMSPSGLQPSSTYRFRVSVNGEGPEEITFMTPAIGSGPNGEITLGDICEGINTGNVNTANKFVYNPSWAGTSPLANINNAQNTGSKMLITNHSNVTTYTSLLGAVTYGRLQIMANSVGASSQVEVSAGSSNNMLSALAGYNAVASKKVDGKDAGLKNSATNPDLERERLLTHLIFSPIEKRSDTKYTIVYTLTIFVARSSDT